MPYLLIMKADLQLLVRNIAVFGCSMMIFIYMIVCRKPNTYTIADRATYALGCFFAMGWGGMGIFLYSPTFANQRTEGALYFIKVCRLAVAGVVIGVLLAAIIHHRFGK